MPCATFVGINHHRQSILLGCAFMSHEDIDSYKLVFRTWLEAMGNVHPDAIITDQYQSIKVAIAEVMPNTIHRYCICHIFSKLPLYLSGVRPSKIARGEFKSMVLDSITIEVFERKWTEYIARYNLHTRNWFNKLYSEKENWVPVYLDVYSWAGMLSTQRSEGMHMFFDGYITHQSTLRIFVHQYELAIRAKHEKELEAEYRSKGFQIVCESRFKWEEYTRTICKWFESRGILCYHILKILSHKKIDKIDERYILTRWRSDVIRPHLNRFHQVGYPNMAPEYKTYKSMLKYFDMACDIALGTSVKVQCVKHNLKKMVHDLQN
ncbi:protein FAR-RED IMPAIRED RESPONSE 1-like [Nicotiana tabacum]|uniref:Protein FAR1-RELATED SEQUENCE n=1 Tax=Nicotiana tabacum TaxID=4097 RepID=A0A1S4B5S3_TOBAC|nr:PREDICTED: protein FAR-RED IMPAIRED RESPONSE 1-like [Nicotiana tabacum]